MTSTPPLNVVLKTATDAIAEMLFGPQGIYYTKLVVDTSEWAAYRIWAVVVMLVGVLAAWYMLKLVGSILYYLGIFIVMCSVNVLLTALIVSYCVRPESAGGNVCYTALNNSLSSFNKL
jgi:hypothetical protein